MSGFRNACLAGGGLILLLAGCEAPANDTPSSAASDAPVAASPQPAAPKPIPAMAAHVRWIIPGSNTQFAAEANLPETTEGWNRAAAAARKTAEGAKMLAEASDRPDDPQWSALALAVAEHAEQAALGAEAENPDLLMVADGDMLDSCNGCHAAFRTP